MIKARPAAMVHSFESGKIEPLASGLPVRMATDGCLVVNLDSYS